jgi:hypothetical protein
MVIKELWRESGKGETSFSTRKADMESRVEGSTCDDELKRLNAIGIESSAVEGVTFPCRLRCNSHELQGAAWPVSRTSLT